MSWDTDWGSLFWNAWDQMCLEFHILFECCKIWMHKRKWLRDRTHVETQAFTFPKHLTYAPWMSFYREFSGPPCSEAPSDINSDVGFSTCNLRSTLKNFVILVTFRFLEELGGLCLACIWSGFNGKWGAPEERAYRTKSWHKGEKKDIYGWGPCERDSFLAVFCLVLVFETWSHSIAQASLELMGNPLPQSSKYRDYRFQLPCSEYLSLHLIIKYFKHEN